MVIWLTPLPLNWPRDLWMTPFKNFETLKRSGHETQQPFKNNSDTLAQGQKTITQKLGDFNAECCYVLYYMLP